MSILVDNKIITMDPDIKAQWVADLRSGKYKQGRGKLKSAEKNYCCLGVLCDQASKKGIVEEGQSLDRGQNFYFTSEADQSYPAEAMLPIAVVNWASMRYNGRDDSGTTMGGLPIVDRKGYSIYLDDLNDHGMPFNQIADVIDYFY